jgi:hypothetical protein
MDKPEYDAIYRITDELRAGVTEAREELNAHVRLRRMLTTNSILQLPETSFRQVQSFHFVAGKQWSMSPSRLRNFGSSHPFSVGTLAKNTHQSWVGTIFSVDVDAGFSPKPTGKVTERFRPRTGDTWEKFFSPPAIALFPAPADRPAEKFSDVALLRIV